jgi:alpha-amylase
MEVNMKRKFTSLVASVVLTSALVVSTASAPSQITSQSNYIASQNITSDKVTNTLINNQVTNQATNQATASIEGNETNTSAANNTYVNGTMMQYFEWNYASDGSLWNKVVSEADDLADIGITALWLPPAYKGGSGFDVGYGVYDLYDLGEFDQKGTIRTKYGTKDQYLSAIKAAHDNGIQIYADIVLNHKGNADGTEDVKATQIDWGNRNNAVSGERTIKAWTKFTFPGRGNKYSSFKWDASCFDAVDYDANTNTNAIYLFKDKYFDWKVDNENANYDYLMYADVDFDSSKVVNELKSWGKWYVDIANLDGFRLDAVKHIKYPFFSDWLTYLRNATGKELFTVGEFWSGDLWKLQDYITETNRCLSLFDVPLHNHMQEASKSNGYYDMSKILEGTLVAADPVLAVTFVDNHDTQPGQSLSSYVLDWFKPLAYTLILTRESGYPCVFYGDYYGLAQKESNSGYSQKREIDKIMKARTACAYGAQHDYFDHGDIIGWTREGDSSHTNSGLASIITDGPGGSKKMYVGKQHAGETWYDITGHVADKVTIDSTGHGVFKVNGGSNSIYVSTKIQATTQNTNGNNSLTVYYKTSWTNPHAHYCVGGGSWTEAPGVKMEKVSDGYYKVTVPMGGETSVTMCFNDGGSTWDNNNSNDYSFSPGKYTVNNGKITNGAPAGITDPDNGSGTGTGSNGSSGNGSGTGTGSDGNGSSGNGSGAGTGSDGNGSSGNGSGTGTGSDGNGSSGNGSGSGNGTGSDGSGSSGSGNGNGNGAGTGSNGSEGNGTESGSDESESNGNGSEIGTNGNDEATTGADQNDNDETGNIGDGEEAGTEDGENGTKESQDEKKDKKSKDDSSSIVLIIIVSVLVVAMAIVGVLIYNKKIVLFKKKDVEQENIE